jgi:Ca-activated chloride channel family protein
LGPSPERLVTVPTVLILDASASMNTADAPGPRIDAAKKAAQGLVDKLPDDSVIGLTTYGTGTGIAEAEQVAGCQDVKTLIPLGRLDREHMRQQIAGLTPSGYTPISLALQRAADQLPTDASPQAIVLVSDGEDTCGTPPCDTAIAAKQNHPGLTISTVGFKTEGPASEQLACIARVTGGLFVEATNADQLASRLIAVQNVGLAKKSLTGDGIDDIRLGQSFTDIRKAHPAFPAVADGKVVVSYADCDFGFVDGVLDSIAPHGGGRTIDGITAGSPVSKATELYGTPTDKQISGTGSVLTYTIDANASTAYKMTVEDYAELGGIVLGTIKAITLCRCAPHSSANPTKPSGVTDDTIRNMTFPAGTCGNDSLGWNNTVPITVRDGEGEARTPSGDFGGASITDATMVGWLDADADGTEDALVSFTCFGSPKAMCCAGRTSMMKFIRVFDFSDPTSPRSIGETIMPGSSPLRGKTYGETRGIDQIRVDGSAIITEEKLIYPESATTADLGYSPYATIEVTHRFTNGQWTSSERVVR